MYAEVLSERKILWDIIRIPLESYNIPTRAHVPTYFSSVCIAAAKSSRSPGTAMMMNTCTSALMREPIRRRDSRNVIILFVRRTKENIVRPFTYTCVTCIIIIVRLRTFFYAPEPYIMYTVFGSSPCFLTCMRTDSNNWKLRQCTKAIRTDYSSMWFWKSSVLFKYYRVGRLFIWANLYDVLFRWNVYVHVPIASITSFGRVFGHLSKV